MTDSQRHLIKIVVAYLEAKTNYNQFNSNLILKGDHYGNRQTSTNKHQNR
jgi:hypothetical protein